MRIYLPLILLSLLLVPPAAAAETDEDSYGITEGAQGQKWAILIGVNYQSRQAELQEADDAASQQALPALNNAANDARSIAKMLTDYYDYKTQNVIVLTDAEGTPENELPTKLNIETQLLRIKQTATEEDSLLFFFAGHGIQYESALVGGNNIAILAMDVQLKNGQPQGNTFDLPFGLINELWKIKAHQKLVILDCCHSGEIFNQQGGKIAFQPTSDDSSRQDKSIQTQPTFQAVASCRAAQLASDGRDGNSRFTSALLHGLRRLPAGNGKQNVTIHELLTHTQAYLDDDQRPDCRNLIDMPGEFCFKPNSEADFSKFLVEEKEEAYLRSMVLSRQGNWWFKEMPWFIPSIRAEMVKVYDDDHTITRGSELADLLDSESLKAAADFVLNRSTTNKSVVKQLRLKHAGLLLNADDAKKLKEAYLEIELDLDALVPAKMGTAQRGNQSGAVPPDAVRDLQAVDVHLLAVVKHSLNKDDAETYYKRAIDMYAQEKNSARSKDAEQQPVVNYSLQILNALCRVDYAELLQGNLNKPKSAAEEYKKARDEIDQLAFKGKQKEYAAFFTTFNLCREADAWLKINRWKQADSLLQQAKAVASGDPNRAGDSPVKNHFLEAHVFRRDAWAKMMQWEIEDAIASFNKSNDILMHQFQLEDKDKQEEKESVDASVDQPRQHSIFQKSKDYSSKVAYLHNLHGIAMATRFHGDSVGAAQSYRRLVAEVENAFTQFRHESADADIESQFIGRLINTQERLGDCNLFGNPGDCDLREAVDDYRRAMMRVHLLRDDARKRNTATLLYKQALALSVPSPVVDHELANEMCTYADKIFASEQDRSGSLLDALGVLTTKCVRACQQSIADHQESQTAQNELRECLLAYRDKVGTTPHRDQLELCLFASHILIEHAGTRSKFQTLADTDLLLSFCRVALDSYAGDRAGDEVASSPAGSIKYLRPYFDMAMEAKMKLGDSHVKEMLQIQSEATRGVLDIKSEQSEAVLALYAFKDKAYLIVDIPNGLSTCVPLVDSYYSMDMIRTACEPDNALPLPENVNTSLATWLNTNTDLGENLITARWIDPVRNFHVNVQNSRTVVEKATGERKDLQETSAIKSRFPFTLPIPK